MSNTAADIVKPLRKWISKHDPHLRGHGLASLEAICEVIETDIMELEADIQYSQDNPKNHVSEPDVQDQPEPYSDSQDRLENDIIEAIGDKEMFQSKRSVAEANLKSS